MTMTPPQDGTAAGANVRVVLELVPDTAVIAGTLRGPAGARQAFHGWIELAAALEAVRPRGS